MLVQILARLVSCRMVESWKCRSCSHDDGSTSVLTALTCEMCFSPGRSGCHNGEACQTSRQIRLAGASHSNSCLCNLVAGGKKKKSHKEAWICACEAER